MVVHVFNSSTVKVEAGRPSPELRPGLYSRLQACQCFVVRPCQKSLNMISRPETGWWLSRMNVQNGFISSPQVVFPTNTNLSCPKLLSAAGFLERPAAMI